MTIRPIEPVASQEALVQRLRAALPAYEYTTRGKKAVVIAAGKVTGVQVFIKDPNTLTVIWQIPSMVITMLLVLGVILSGLIPGLLAMGIVYLVVRSDVDKLRREVLSVLTGSPDGEAALPAGPGGFTPPGQHVGSAVPMAPEAGFGAAPGAGAGGFGTASPGGFTPPAAPVPAAPQGPQPGAALSVQGPDGQAYSAQFVRHQDGHVLCRFGNGQEQWYEERLVQLV